WVLAPRDLVVARLTGQVVTDPSLASRTGWFAIEGGGWTSVGLDAAGERLPPGRPSTTMADGLVREGAGDLAPDRCGARVRGARGSRWRGHIEATDGVVGNNCQRLGSAERRAIRADRGTGLRGRTRRLRAGGGLVEQRRRHRLGRIDNRLVTRRLDDLGGRGG